jgi:hypothetical protein
MVSPILASIVLLGLFARLAVNQPEFQQRVFRDAEGAKRDDRLEELNTPRL